MKKFMRLVVDKKFIEIKIKIVKYPVPALLSPDLGSEKIIRESTPSAVEAIDEVRWHVRYLY